MICTWWCGDYGGGGCGDGPGGDGDGDDEVCGLLTNSRPTPVFVVKKTVLFWQNSLLTKPAFIGGVAIFKV